MSGLDELSASRLCRVAGLRNLRDIGGLPVAGGGVTRRRLVYRGEAPTGLRAPELRELGELGLRSAIDLRDEATEDVFVASTLPDDVKRLAAGIRPPSDSSGKGLVAQVMDGERTSYSAAELGEMYIDFLATRAPAFGQAVSHVADADSLPTLIHCHIGKDRTGIVVALILEALEVPREAILDDYELTTECRSYRRQEVEGTLSRWGTEWEAVAALFTAPRETLELALEFVTDSHGSVRGYLEGPAGVDASTLDELRKVLVTEQR
jgi:protein-tyrosine phosphatase